MRRTNHIGPRTMHRRMNHIRRGIQQPTRAPIDDLPIVIDEDQIRALDHAERHAERVHPEGGRVDGVAERDVARDTFVVAQLAEDAEGERQPAFQVGSFLVFVGEAWWGGEFLKLDLGAYSILVSPGQVLCVRLTRRRNKV